MADGNEAVGAGPDPAETDAQVKAEFALLTEARRTPNMVATAIQAVVRGVEWRLRQDELLARAAALRAAAQGKSELMTAYHQGLDEWRSAAGTHARRSSAIGTAYLRARGRQGRTRASRRIR